MTDAFAPPLSAAGPTVGADGRATLVHPYRVRFDEAGPDGLLRTSCLLRYAQDVAWIHSEALGFDRAWYVRRGLLWLVRAAVVDVLAAIPMGVELSVSTAVVGFRKVWARRLGEVRLAEGTVVATVRTDWVLIDERGKPIRIPPEFDELFPSPPLSQPITRVDLPATPAGARSMSMAVRPQDLDPNDHANNAAYLDWLEEALLDAGATSAVRALGRRYQLEFAAAAHGGARLDAATWHDDGGWAHRLSVAGGADLFRARLG